MPSFVNLSPARAGVYRWYAETTGQVPVVVYIGNSDDSTLKRAQCEWKRDIFRQNTQTGFPLDTNFIVGTAVRYFEKNGYSCVCQHIDDDSRKELDYIGKQRPILQPGPKDRILLAYKMKVPKSHPIIPRTPETEAEAERHISALLEKAMTRVTTAVSTAPR